MLWFNLPSDINIICINMKLTNLVCVKFYLIFLVHFQSTKKDGCRHDPCCTCILCCDCRRNQRHCMYIFKNRLYCIWRASVEPLKSSHLKLVNINWKLHFMSLARKLLWSHLLPKKALFRFTILWIQRSLCSFQDTLSSQIHLNHMR